MAQRKRVLSPLVMVHCSLFLMHQVHDLQTIALLSSLGFLLYLLQIKHINVILLLCIILVVNFFKIDRIQMTQSFPL